MTPKVQPRHVSTEGLASHMPPAEKAGPSGETGAAAPGIACRKPCFVNDFRSTMSTWRCMGPLTQRSGAGRRGNVLPPHPTGQGACGRPREGYCRKNPSCPSSSKWWHRPEELRRECPSGGCDIYFTPHRPFSSSIHGDAPITDICVSSPVHHQGRSNGMHRDGEGTADETNGIAQVP